MNNNKEIKKFYEDFTKNLIRDKFYPNPRHKKIKRYLKYLFDDRKIDSVLEIGCGIGVISEFISNKASKVVGIDISEENIKFARTTVKEVSFYCTDFFEFSSENKFDLITLFDVLEHVPKEKHGNLFRKIVGLSNPSTVVMITIPDPHYTAYVRKSTPEKLQVIDEEIHFDEILKIFNEFDLEIIKYEKYGIDLKDQYGYYLLGHRKTDKNYSESAIVERRLV